MGGGRDGALTDSLWSRRERRAIQLARRHSPAAEALRYYLEVLKSQEPLAYHARLPAWRQLARQDGIPALDLSRLPRALLLDDFATFIGELTAPATPILADVAAGLLDDRDLLERSLGAVLEDRPADRSGPEGVFADPEQAFFPWAFLQPIAVALAEDLVLGPDPSMASCPACGRLAVAGVLSDDAERLGRRRLVCSLCATAWPFPRLTCPTCGETGAARLEHHVSESWPHVRIDVCGACSTYIKTIDSRTAGDAEPIVDEIASLELDVWADQRGLAKHRRNLFGL